MPEPTDTQHDPREIAKWAKRYAQSRTIPFLIQWLLIVILVIVVGVLSFMALDAYQARKPRLVWLCIAGDIAATLALTWFSVGKWGGEKIWRISQWLYGKEGYAAYIGGADAKRSRWIQAVGAGLAIWHLAGAALVAFRPPLMVYIQPLSALYMVPFLIVMIVSQRLGFWAWFWPVLYGLHAVLLLAGVLPHFPGKWQVLDVIAPIFGYALVSILVGHAYSRYAFRRLRECARAGLVEDPGEPEEGADPRSGDERPGDNGSESGGPGE